MTRLEQQLMATQIVEFDATSGCWMSNNAYNRRFLASQERYWNDVLRSRRHVFLNEIYDSIGVKRTSCGQLFGWLAEDTAEIRFDTLEHDDDQTITVQLKTQGIIWDRI